MRLMAVPSCEGGSHFKGRAPADQPINQRRWRRCIADPWPKDYRHKRGCRPTFPSWYCQGHAKPGYRKRRAASLGRSRALTANAVSQHQGACGGGQAGPGRAFGYTSGTARLRSRCRPLGDVQPSEPGHRVLVRRNMRSSRKRGRKSMPRGNAVGRAPDRTLSSRAHWPSSRHG